MKKLVLGLFATIMFTTACYSQKTVTLKSSVTEKEYAAMDNTDKKIVNHIDGAIAALKAMNMNEVLKNKQTAIVSLSLSESKLDNSIVIGQSEGNTSSVQSCLICGMSSGITCFKRIRTQLSNGTIIITVELVGECVQLTW